ncbi:hypothetical protein GCM10009087_40530 [Sphingomonas oligophenolica]|uniref:Uncharacterized protein n=1 Tax=Sphingomonas oligophenolica TaxID=301154 RepID=A0ABU9Y231_9SPHN
MILMPSVSALIAQTGVSVIASFAAAYAVLKILGKGWIDSYFSKQIEQFKADQAGALEEQRRQIALQLEHIKFDSSKLMDRAIKLHQQEFDILPTLWDRITHAIGATLSLTNSFQLRPEIAHMGAGELQDVIRHTPLTEWERGKLVELPADERNAALWNMLSWHRFRSATDDHSAFHNYLISKGIFIETVLREEILALSNLNYDALKEVREKLESGESGSIARRALEKGWQAHFTSIQEQIRARLLSTSLSEEAAPTA